MNVHTANPALSKFIAAVMDPLPTEVLVDTAYNTMARRARREAWRKVKKWYDLYDSLANAARELDTLVRCGGESVQGVTLPDWRVCIEMRRVALAKLLMTPAPDYAAADWKRRQKTSYLPLRAEDLERSIAEDMAFLAAHPTTNKPRRRSASND